MLHLIGSVGRRHRGGAVVEEEEVVVVVGGGEKSVGGRGRTVRSYPIRSIVRWRFNPNPALVPVSDITQ